PELGSVSGQAIQVTAAEQQLFFAVAVDVGDGDGGEQVVVVVPGPEFLAGGVERVDVALAGGHVDGFLIAAERHAVVHAHGVFVAGGGEVPELLAVFAVDGVNAV